STRRRCSSPPPTRRCSRPSVRGATASSRSPRNLPRPARVASVQSMRACLAIGLLLAGLGLARADKTAPFVFPDPYFGGDGARAIELLGRERWGDARAALAAFAASKDAPADAAGKARVAFLAGLCDRRLGRWADATAELDAAAADLPLLVDYARYFAAEAYA